jgi:hypothetical protein
MSSPNRSRLAGSVASLSMLDFKIKHTLGYKPTCDVHSYGSDVIAFVGTLEKSNELLKLSMSLYKLQNSVVNNYKHWPTAIKGKDQKQEAKQATKNSSNA